jgi:hypothetical protein
VDLLKRLATGSGSISIDFYQAKMQANRRHMVTQVEIANKRSDEKKANEKEGRIKPANW